LTKVVLRPRIEGTLVKNLEDSLDEEFRIITLRNNQEDSIGTLHLRKDQKTKRIEPDEV